MLYYIMLRIIFAIYFIIVAVMWYNALSHFLFSNQQLKRRWKYLYTTVILSTMWPLSLFSRAGRVKIIKQLKGKL